MKSKTLRKEDKLIEAVKAIEESDHRTVVVTDKYGLLLGTLTDGDIRRSLLKNGSLEIRVKDIMNKNPVTALENSSHKFIFNLMKKANVMSLPIINKKNEFIKLIHLKEIDYINKSVSNCKFDFAVIMAGGEGKRLRPFTNDIPKPMIHINGIPLIERQIRTLKDIGIKKVYISVNYLSHIIEEYFQDGQELNIEIKYIRENEKLGTAGALSLIKEVPRDPILVLNGDVLTNLNFINLYDYHLHKNAFMTVTAIEYRVAIPYGVIQESDGFINKIQEKPSQRFLCSAGIYVISPNVLKFISPERYFEMTELLEICISKSIPIAVYPIHEYWSDIGTPNDLEKARKFFKSRNNDK